MYAGNIGLPHGVEILIEVAEKLRDEEDLRLCIVGRGEYLDRIVASVKYRGLLNVVFPPRQPEKMVPLIWASADASVVTYKPGLAEYSMPSKLLFIMASGRPAIVSADADSDVCTTVAKARCGLNVPPGDAMALSDAVRYLKTNPELRKEMGQRGQEYVKQHFEKMSVVGKFENLFMELSGLQ
jgi:colanic acid biosynthesis glycosyl transferase WcaI